MIKKSLALLFALVLTVAAFMVIAGSAVSSEGAFGNSWSAKTPMPQAASGVRAADVDGTIHVIGGSVHYVYDHVTDGWADK